MSPEPVMAAMDPLAPEPELEAKGSIFGSAFTSLRSMVSSSSSAVDEAARARKDRVAQMKDPEEDVEQPATEAKSSFFGLGSLRSKVSSPPRHDEDLRMELVEEMREQRKGVKVKQLGKNQFRLMLNVQLKIEQIDSRAITDEWIDSLFDRYDADSSGLMDDSEWDDVVARLKMEVRALGPVPGDVEGTSWTVCIDEEGDKFYQHRDSGVKQIKMPEDVALALNMSDKISRVMQNRHANASEWEARARKMEDGELAVKQLGKNQFRLMLNVQLKIEQIDSRAITDEWIDSLFDRYDADSSGLMDDSEWDYVVARLKMEVRALGPVPGDVKGTSWTVCIDEEGDKFYRHRTRGETAWVMPDEVAKKMNVI